MFVISFCGFTISFTKVIPLCFAM